MWVQQEWKKIGGDELASIVEEQIVSHDNAEEVVSKEMLL